MYIKDNKTSLYQWDLNQKVIVENELVKEVHFTNASLGNALIVEVEDGIAEIPNILLQESFDIKAYGYCGECVRETLIINVIARTKPTDYVYTETEVRQWEDIVGDIEELQVKDNALDEDIQILDTRLTDNESKTEALEELTDRMANILSGIKKTEFHNSHSVTLKNIVPIEHDIAIRIEARNKFPVSFGTRDMNEWGILFPTRSAYKNGVDLVQVQDADNDNHGLVTLDGTCTANCCFSFNMTCNRTGTYYLCDYGDYNLFENSDTHPRLEVWNRTKKVGYSTKQDSNYNTIISFPLEKGDELKIAIWVFKGHDYTGAYLRPVLCCGYMPPPTYDATYLKPCDGDRHIVSVKDKSGKEIKTTSLHMDNNHIYGWPKIKSQSQSYLKLVSESKNIDMEVIYNQDINAAVQELTDAIISLGGNV